MEQCGIKHGFGDQTCIREKGHVGMCRSMLDARAFVRKLIDYVCDGGLLVDGERPDAAKEADALYEAAVEEYAAELLPHLTQHPTDAEPLDARAFVPERWVADYFSRVVSLCEGPSAMSIAEWNAKSRVLVAEALAELLPHLASVSEIEALRAERDELQAINRGVEVAYKRKVFTLESERDGLRARVTELEGTAKPRKSPLTAEMLAEHQAVWNSCNSCGSRETPEYSVEHDNFYCRSCRCGMGTEYYEAHREEAGKMRSSG